MYADKERAKLNSIYQSAKQRCINIHNKNYPDYGGRGIQFKFNSFTEFLAELGPKPYGYTLDRINNNGYYEKNNVRWATRQQQNSNKRKQKNNTSGVSGVVYNKRDNLWQSFASIKKKKSHLYTGSDFFEACCARKSWESSKLC